MCGQEKYFVGFCTPTFPSEFRDFVLFTPRKNCNEIDKKN